MTTIPIENASPMQANRFAPAVLFPLFVGLSLIAYAGLTVTFGFPDILRAPAPDILAAFRAQEAFVRGFYYLFAIAHLVFAAAVLTLYPALKEGAGPWLLVGTAGGILYGIAQTMGFLRWPILIPLFADYAATRDMSGGEGDLALLMLNAFHHYTGNAIGENLSFWGLGAWLVGIGMTLRQAAFGHRAVGMLWILTGLMVFAYTFEQLGGPFAVLAPLLLLSHGMAYGLILALSWSLRKSSGDHVGLAPVGPMAGLAITVFCAAIVVPGLLP